VIAACEWIFGKRPLADVVRFLAAAGCDGIEIGGDPSRADRHELEALLAGAGLEATGITALCRWPTEERDLAHPDGESRRRAVDYYRGCIDLALLAGAPVVGLIPIAVGRVQPLTTVEQEWQLAVEGARELAAYAGERGVTVAVEAINRYESFLVPTAERALAFADDVGEANVAVILDAFHMNIEEADPQGAVALAGSRLAALHLADSNRRGLGHGHLDVTDAVRAARQGAPDAPFVLECTAPGPDPFQPDKGPAAMALLDVDIRESVGSVRALLEDSHAAA
jgi:D-psicose/D-tagatose/L-ribulose 3-epimerase